jgi:hypothetical protein
MSTKRKPRTTPIQVSSTEEKIGTQTRVIQRDIIPPRAAAHPRAAAPPPQAPRTKDKIKRTGKTREQIRSVSGTQEAHSLTTGDKGWRMNL